MTRSDPPQEARLKHNGLNLAALALVWVTISISSIVFVEPAPVDALLMGLVLALPVLGLVAVRPGMVLIFFGASLWAIGLLLGVTQITDDYRVAEPGGGDFAVAIRSTFISTYLLFAVVVLTGFIALRPVAHSRLVLSAVIAAGLLASTLAVLGYIGALGPFSQMFVLFDRASGTFKDPNVLGSFLVLPLMAATSLALNGRATVRLFGLAAAGLIAVAILLSFSRGAWLMTAVAITVYVGLAFVTAGSNRSRLEIIGAVTLLFAGLLGLVGAMLQSPDLAEFFAERARLFQSYDTGPEGRFGGQARAVGVIIDHPAGIGAYQFVPRYHPELPHNVYLNMFLAGGWLSGFVYGSLVLGTMLFGFIHALRRTAHQHLFIAAYAAFISLIVIGFFVDTHHWRHFYINAALVWGMMIATPGVAWTQVRAAAARPARILAEMAPTPVPVRVPQSTAAAAAIAQLRLAADTGSPEASAPGARTSRRRARIRPMVRRRKPAIERGLPKRTARIFRSVQLTDDASYPTPGFAQASAAT